VGSPLIKSGAEIGSQTPPFFCLHGIIVPLVMPFSFRAGSASIRRRMGSDRCPADTVHEKDLRGKYANPSQKKGNRHLQIKHAGCILDLGKRKEFLPKNRPVHPADASGLSPVVSEF
jgi:hypothetical protein